MAATAVTRRLKSKTNAHWPSLSRPPLVYLPNVRLLCAPPNAVLWCGLWLSGVVMVGTMPKRLSATEDAFRALSDDTRRRVYLAVCGQHVPIRRDEVASLLGISPKLAAFHLEKLLRAGLLSAQYARPGGRSGPGAGRTAKFYERSSREIDVTIPERRYDLVAEVLLEAVEQAHAGDEAGDIARRVARERGLSIGESAHGGSRRRRLRRDRALAEATDLLDALGFEPYRLSADEVALRNCPFHRLAQRSPELVCSINCAFIEGIVHGMGGKDVEAALTPRDGQCCVTVRAR
jgi:predicted ArsR family transcriptional regulator